MELFRKLNGDGMDYRAGDTFGKEHNLRQSDHPTARWLDCEKRTMLPDLKFALRMLVKKPGFTRRCRAHACAWHRCEHRNL